MCLLLRELSKPDTVVADTPGNISWGSNLVASCEKTSGVVLVHVHVLTLSCLGGLVVRALVMYARDRGFESCSGQFSFFL